jgi:hypothetical protein
MGPKVYRIWLTLQGIISASITLSFLSGLLFLDIRYILLAIGLLALHIIGCTLGTSVWELMNLLGHDSVSFNVDEVKNVEKGHRWARKSLRLFILLYVLTMNYFSKGQIVSFEAPENKNSKNVVYALMFWDLEDEAFFTSLFEMKNRG